MPLSPILVTGAAGFAGGHLLDLLAGDARPIVAWRQASQAHTPSTSSGAASLVSWLDVELLQPDSIADALRETQPSEVYHLAGIAHQGASWQQTTPTLEVNVLGTHHLLDGLRRVGSTAPVLVIGSATVYRPSNHGLDESSAIGPTSPYGLSKLGQELVSLHAHSVYEQPVIVSRSFNHIGPRQSPDFVASSFARQIAEIELKRRDPVIDVGNLEARRDLTDVRDTVRAYREIVRRGRPGAIYNVCRGEAVAIRDLLDGLLAQTTVPIEVRVDPARMRPVDQPLLLGRYDRLNQDTGWTPMIPMRQTLGDLLQYWRDQLSAGAPASSEAR